MTLKCIIVDDEPPAIRLLESYVARIASLEKIAVFTDSLKALEFLNNNTVDVVFLDIQMPQLTGIQLSRIIAKNISVIFTTAFPNFAVEGFELNATDYLLKPIAFDRFCQAIFKLSPVTGTEPATTPSDYVFIKTAGKNRFAKVLISDILYIESLQNYVCIHIPDDKIIAHTSLKSILASLPSGFLQIHKSYVVSLKQISSTDNFSVFVQAKELPIGSSYKTAFFEQIRKSSGDLYTTE